MAQVINTNVAALFASSALNRSNNALQTAQQRLSSGLRINSAKDDITGMTSAANYDKLVRGANTAIRGANDGISKAQINDGYLSQILENFQRLREIAVSSGDVAATTGANKEAIALIAENVRLQALQTNSAAVVIESDGTTGGTAGTSLIAAAVAAASSTTIALIDASITLVIAARATYGADMATLGSAVSALQTESVNNSAAYSRVMDTDYAAETAAASKNQILQQAGMAALAQANQNPQSVLTLLR